MGFSLQFVDTDNWTPFIPESQGPGQFGWDGVLRGASIVFFAYIGFDAVSTAAQEAKNPQRDMPIGILGSLVICTLIYIAMSAVMTGIMPYNLLGTPEAGRHRARDVSRACCGSRPSSRSARSRACPR